MKMTIDLKELCKDVPIEFPIILEYKFYNLILRYIKTL